jgi:hypothetical protein
MKIAAVLVALAAIVAGLILLYTASAPGRATVATAEKSTSAIKTGGQGNKPPYSANSRPSTVLEPARPATSAPVSGGSYAPPSEDKESTAEILSLLEEASFTYDPASLKDIRPYLSSSDPIVRQAALDAVVTLGDRAGAEVLREAAKKARDASEAADLRAKADYLELPPASLFSPEKIQALRSGQAVKQQPQARPRPVGIPRGNAIRGGQSGHEPASRVNN